MGAEEGVGSLVTNGLRDFLSVSLSS